ncbi:MAG: hypothetical protein A2041_10530 [Bacteroidetes bacterium GWA2_31_9b]|nr:MAG: hypothetical protein A2041_10530 [Bacteroidetes bacterium GWA2_31_9b]
MRKIILIFLVVLIQLPLIAQINKNGIPFIKNFTKDDYNAAEQNWAICQDNRGVMYFGNNDQGVIEFDGVNWNNFPLLNGSIVRSLACSNEGIVYAGGIEEFGYLAPDINGLMNYHSLSNQIDSIKFKDVWKIYTLNEYVYFCTNYEIFKFSNKKLIKIYQTLEKSSFLSFLVNNKIYWGSINNGLSELTEDSVILSKGNEFYKELDIFVMLPWTDNEILILATGQETGLGVYIYNTSSGLSQNLSTQGKNYNKLVKLLNESQVYNGIKLSNGNYALATLNNGSIIFNKNGEIIYQFNTENGLTDNTIINLFESKDGNLWFGLNTGIAYAELSTPFTRLGQEYGFEGIVLDVFRFNNTLFISTNNGIFYLDYNTKDLPKFIKIDVEILGQTVWQINKYIDSESKKELLLFATAFGVWKYNSSSHLENLTIDKPYHTKVIYQSKIHPERLYIGYENGIAYLEYKNGKFTDKGKLINCSDYIESIVEDNKGNIWLGTQLTGVIKINPNLSFTKFDLNNGLPDMKDNKAYLINNEVLLSTAKGVYYYDSINNTFLKYKGFGEKYYSSTDNIKQIYLNNKDELWFVLVNPLTNNEYIEKLKISNDSITIHDVPFKRLLKNSFYKIFDDNDKGTWIATSNAIYNYNVNAQDNFSKNYFSLIRKTEIGIDSVVFWGTFYKDSINFIVNKNQPEILKQILSYKYNSILFNYSSPYFPMEQLKYSYKLEGYEKEWSNWGSKSDKEYTNLNSGSYVFKVKAQNIYEIESEVAEFEFSILPPWYLTIWAYMLYFLMAIGVIVIIVKLYTRKLQLEKIWLEQVVKERTEEVVKQKDEIADKNKSITDSIEYAKRIQNAVLPSKELAQEILPEHFILFRPRDIVSGDFYWFTKKDNLLIIIAADCTGHGVPGAFMSMLGVSFINEIVNKHDVIYAGDILTHLRSDVKRTLSQTGKEGEAKDGMDIALCIVDIENMKMQYAGAYNPMFMFRNNELIEYKADRMPIGIYVKEKESFTNNEIDLQKGDVFYLFSDGYQDQFGGETGEKFKTKNFKEYLLQIHQKPMAEQRELLNANIDKWRGRWEQVDDIIILGIKI